MLVACLFVFGCMYLAFTSIELIGIQGDTDLAGIMLVVFWYGFMVIFSKPIFKFCNWLDLNF